MKYATKRYVENFSIRYFCIVDDQFHWLITFLDPILWKCKKPLSEAFQHINSNFPWMGIHYPVHNFRDSQIVRGWLERWSDYLDWWRPISVEAHVLE